MDKEAFINNFKLLLVDLHDLTARFCFNELSTNYKFILEPSERTIGAHLTETENDYLKTWNRLSEKQILFDDVIRLFYKRNLTPKWADCSIYYSTPKLTVVHIFFSRQFKDETEIYYLDRGTGPFKAVVNIPPDNLRIVQDNMFDVNWKKHLDDSKRNLFEKLNLWVKNA